MKTKTLAVLVLTSIMSPSIFAETCANAKALEQEVVNVMSSEGYAKLEETLSYYQSQESLSEEQIAHYRKVDQVRGSVLDLLQERSDYRDAICDIEETLERVGSELEEGLAELNEVASDISEVEDDLAQAGQDLSLAQLRYQESLDYNQKYFALSVACQEASIISQGKCMTYLDTITPDQVRFCGEVSNYPWTFSRCLNEAALSNVE